MIEDVGEAGTGRGIAGLRFAAGRSASSFEAGWRIRIGEVWWFEVPQ